MASPVDNQVISNIVNFTEKQVKELKDFTVLSNTIYRVDKTFTIKDSDETEAIFMDDHCKLLKIDEEGSNNIREFTFNEGELYLYAEIFVSDETTVSKQLIPLSTPIDELIKSSSFTSKMDEYVEEYISKAQLITRNQLRIRSNNIQAWVVNNFIAKNSKGKSEYIPGTVKVSETDSKYGYLKDKIVSSDESIEVEVVESNDGKKLNLTTKFSGIAFADVVLRESDWKADTDGSYKIDLDIDKIKDVINSDRSDCYLFIKGIDAYIKNSDNTFSEFSVDKVYAFKQIPDPVDRSISRSYYYIKSIKSNEKHEIHLVLYLTNGSTPGDSSKGEPTEFIKSAEVSEDGKTLTLVDDEDNAITFSPRAVGCLADLDDFKGEQGEADLSMFQSLLEITREDYSEEGE